MKQTCGPFSPGADPKVTANAAGEMDALRAAGVSCVFFGRRAKLQLYEYYEPHHG